MTTYTSITSGVQVLPAFPSYCQIGTVLSPFNADRTLSWSTDFQNQNQTVCNLMDVTATAPGLVIKLPDARYAAPGQSFKMNNRGANIFDDFDVHNNADVFLFTAHFGTITEVYLTDNATQGGVWSVSIPPGGTSVTSINAISADVVTAANLVIAGVPALPINTAGTLNFTLDGDLRALSSFGINEGIPARTGVEQWTLRTLTGTNNQIVVFSGNGALTDPTFSLANDIKGVTSIELLAFLSSPAMQSGFLTLGEPLSSVLPIVPETGELLFYNAASDFAVSLSAPLVAPGNYRLYFPVSLPNTPVYAGSATIPLASDLNGNLSFDAGGMLRKVVTLTPASFRGMSATEVELVPQPGAGFVVVPHKFCMNVHSTGVAYAGGGNVFLKYSGVAAALIGEIPPFAAIQAQDTFSFENLSSGGDSSALIENRGISITNLTGAFTAGDATSTVDVTVWYSVIPI